MRECGVMNITYQRNKEALFKLGWLRVKNKSRVILTNNDLIED